MRREFPFSYSGRKYLVRRKKNGSDNVVVEENNILIPRVVTSFENDFPVSELEKFAQEMIDQEDPILLF